jgi:hypothetical protein
VFKICFYFNNNFLFHLADPLSGLSDKPSFWDRSFGSGSIPFLINLFFSLLRLKKSLRWASVVPILTSRQLSIINFNIMDQFEPPLCLATANQRSEVFGDFDWYAFS